MSSRTNTSEFSASCLAPAANSGAAYASMLASVGGGGIAVTSISVVTRTNVAAELSLERAFAVGTATSAATGVPHMALGPESTAVLESAWSSPPTGTTKAFRQLVVAPATGTRVELWRDEDGAIAVEPGESLVIRNVASGAGPALVVSVDWSEGLR